MTYVSHVDSCRETGSETWGTCENESHGKFREVGIFTPIQQMFAEHLSGHVPYQLELRRYLFSNAVSLINPKILLRDVLLKQSGVKAKKKRKKKEELH